MKKHEILENIRIDKLIYGGLGLATAPDGMKVMVSGGAIPESIVDLRITRAHKNRYEAQILRTVKRSPFEQDLPPGWQIYGGCKWLQIPYEKQLEIKESQIREAFHVLKSYTEDTIFHPITPSPEQIAYRNKVEFSWGKYISDREGVHDEFRFGFHAPAQFDRIIDCEYCVLADEETNTIFRKIDAFSRNSGYSTYDPKTGIGFWRHLVVRKAKKTDEIMLLWSVNTAFQTEKGVVKNEKNGIISEITRFSTSLAQEFPHIVSVYILHNTGRADIVTGEEMLIFGKASITEELLGKTFEIQPKSFFQTNSLGAEKLYQMVIDLLVEDETRPSSGERDNTLLDLYGGTGTIGLLLANAFKKVYSVELVSSASEDGKKNALRNNVDNIEFINEKTEDFLPKFLSSLAKPESGEKITLIVDPPRDGMHPKACADLLKFSADTVIYVSCNPSTLVRDLAILLGKNGEKGENEMSQGGKDDPKIADAQTLKHQYIITDIMPMDMFPHTHHIETVVKLVKS